MPKFKSFVAAGVAVGMAMFMLALPTKAGEVDFASGAFATKQRGEPACCD